MFTWVGAGLYIFTAILCGAALFARPHSTHRGSLPDRARLLWLAIALLFLVLAGSRLTGSEEVVRAGMRAMITREGEYEARRSAQAPLAAAALVLACCGAAAALYTRRVLALRLGMPLLYALAAALGMVLLVALRLVSFHQTDALLYGRPFHLNWVLDLGLTLVVAASAGLALRGPRRPRPVRRR